MSQPRISIGIVGFGPKGLYGFERLLANLHQMNEKIEVHVHLFNAKGDFATGWIYQPDQPDFLLMNYSNAFITMHPDAAPSPICEIMSFSEWCANCRQTSTSAEDKRIASRGEVGEYLSYYFNCLCDSARSNIIIHKNRGKVTAIIPVKGKYRLETDTEFQSPLFATLLLTTGHSPSITSKLSQSKKSKNCIPFVYPVQEKLQLIPKNVQVACKGIGLTAIDSILALTEGRGGEFEQSNDSEIIYRKSGKEPTKIYPFSRSGYPIIPRLSNGVTLTQHSCYLKKWVSSLSENCSPFDFEKEVLPLIKQDITTEYYYQLFQNYKLRLNAQQEYEKVLDEIQEFHRLHPEEKKFEADELLHPPIRQSNNAHEDFLTYWKKTVDWIKTENSPFVAAANTWGNLVDDFNWLYKNDKLTADSRSKFISTYFSMFNRISYGPPLQNVQKIIALAAIGVVDFSFVNHPHIAKTYSDKYELKSHEEMTACEWMIDARLPRDFTINSNVLYTSSCKRNGLFSFLNKHTNSDFANGLNCNEAGNPISEEGEVISNITLYGTPAEGKLFDNDSLSRKRNDTASQWAKQTIQLIYKTLIPEHEY